MQLPSEPSAGAPIDATWGQNVVQCLRALRPRGGPGMLVSDPTGQGTMISALDRHGGGVPRGPRNFAPKMFRVSCWLSNVYVRYGFVQWGGLTIVPEVHDDDAEFIVFDGDQFIIENGLGWTDDESRYPYVETVFGSTSKAYVRITSDSTIPNDDGLALTVRWPLAEVTGWQITMKPLPAEGEAELVFWTEVADVCHEGIIKIPGAFGPPGSKRRRKSFGAFAPAGRPTQ